LTLCLLQLYFEVLLASLATMTVAIASAAAIQVARDLAFLHWWRNRKR